MNITGFDRVPPIDPHRAQLEALELADNVLEQHTNQDNSFPTLVDKMRVPAAGCPTLSGLQECDYPTSVTFPDIANINHFKLLNKIPLPPEILEQCGNLHGSYSMGLFADINRAWLAIDSDIYMWNYETGGDVAYYDGLSDSILCVGLVKPKEGIFQSFIKRLLILTTSSEIIVLGVSLVHTADRKQDDELQLTPEIVYSLGTEGVPITAIAGTTLGRIFLGGRDGSLFEIVYQKEIGWWGKRCKKVNHSRGALSFLLPSFINSAFFEEDPVLQIAVDNSRHILYTLTERSAIEVFDLGADGRGISRVASLSYSALFNRACEIVSTLDPREIDEVVSICPLEETDSIEIGVVAVTKTGVRLYLSTGSQPRPSTLQLLHVRLPPGYAAHTTPMASGQVSLAKYFCGYFMLVTTVKDTTQDQLWCLSSHVQPLKTWLIEMCSLASFSGPTIAVGLTQKDELNEEKFSGPLVVYENNHQPDRIAVLTNSGTDIYEVLRPVDILAELLQEKNGPDCDAVRNYFALQGHDQACATSLILACNRNTGMVQVSDWASRAFFMYGGEPKHVIQPQPPAMQYSLPAGFKPNTVSTPLGNRPVPQPQPDTYQVQWQMSAKHNGLYLYLSRILRPIWNKRIVSRVFLNDSKGYLISNVLAERIARVSSQLISLRAFLEKNPQISSTQTVPNFMAQDATGIDMQGVSPALQRSRMAAQEAVNQEIRSLECLRTLVDHSAQVLGLWKIMCDHQFHVITESLTVEQQNQMIVATFRDLILLGQELCASLINKLINTYLNDNTSVDTISAKLREVCPSLYRNEDAACSKANEILQVAKDVTDQKERFTLLRSAIKLCKEVSPNVNLSWVCKQLINCKYYEGVLEVCLDAADKLDPNCLAIGYYENGQPVEDALGYKAYVNRLSAYHQITLMLDHLHHQCQFSGAPSLSTDNPNSAAQKTLQDVLIQCLDTKDDVLHIVCYEWLSVQGLYSSLVTFGRPSLKKYLSYNSNDSNLRDLLWQYHERTGDHAAAARILFNLANTPGDSIKLYQRLTYLGKAVMCMRSDGAGCAPHLGVFLHELEDAAQVARVQKQILDKITNLAPRDSRAEEAIKKLNSSLLTITELFEGYAEPFGLWECKLTILDCAGHEGRDLIHLIWDNIISEELVKCRQSSNDDQMTIVMSKIKSLGLQFTVQSPCFPIAYLVWQLEVLSCRLNVNKNHVHTTLTSIGVSVTCLLEIYDKMFSLNDRCWLLEGNEFHLIQVIASFADGFLTNPRLCPVAERKIVAVRMQDLITNCLSTLYSKPDTKQLVTYLKSIQTKLKNISV